MSRKFISLVLAASVAIAGVGATATPAKAGNDDLAKLLVGATALVIIGTAINESKKNGNVVVHQPQRHTPQAHTPRHQPRHAHVNTPRHRAAIPQQCRVVVNTFDGPVKGYGARCLNNTMRAAHSLPNQCRQVVNQVRGGHTRVLYNGRCLARHGYNVASR